MTSLRIFHTADWHLGKNFGTVDRTADFREFLNDFLKLIEERRPDVLLISGDVFDTSMPSSAAQALYYDFIGRLSATDVSLTVITAGNHDSQRFLEAPSPIFSAMRTVIAGESPESEAVVFEKDGIPVLGIGAVPYLREGDVRNGSLEYTDQDRSRLFEAGVLHRYEEVRDLIDEFSEHADIPTVAMGHLFVTGALKKPDGKPIERSESIHVGSLRNVSVDAFGKRWDYIALGHIHNSQQVKNNIPTFFSGSPLALSFGHRNYEHIIVEINIDESRQVDVIKHPVRQPREFFTISGSFEELLDAIRTIGRKHHERPPFIEAKLTSADIVTDLAGRLQEEGEKVGVHVMSVRNDAAVRRLLADEEVDCDLAELTPEEVFKTLLREQSDSDEEASALYDEFSGLFREVEESVLIGK